MTSNIEEAPVAPAIDETFDRTLYGNFGEFGAGANINAFYLQSAMDTSRLKEIRLINEIPGSEKWSVRELFQREVDMDRVTKEIRPHFEDPKTVNFFAPITLTLIPKNESGQLLDELPRAVEDNIIENGVRQTVLTRGVYYRFKYNNKNFATLEWSSTRVELVAIDGQHRLSTLRQIGESHEEVRIPEFQNWRIPIIVASFRAADLKTQPPTVLEVVRRLFTNINTESKTVSFSRQILLNDTKPNMICTQELIQRSHENDLKSNDEVDGQKLPLLAFDWRSTSTTDERDVEPQYSSNGLKSIVELHDWFENYVLYFDFSSYQRSVLCDLRDIGNELRSELKDANNKSLPIHLNDDLRTLVNREFIPALSFLLENFAPYKSFISAIRTVELTEYQNIERHTVKHALDELRYGRNFHLVLDRPMIESALEEIKKDIINAKQKTLPYLFERAIGMRGVVAAYGILAHYLFAVNETVNWMDLSKIFTRTLNDVYKDGWLDDREKKKSYGNRYLQHVARDHDRKIVNFKHQDVPKALGNYIALLVCCYSMDQNANQLNQTLMDDDEDFWSTLFDNYRRRLIQGFKKEIRPFVKDESPLYTSSMITREVTMRAERATEIRQNEFIQCIIENAPQAKPWVEQFINGN